MQTYTNAFPGIRAPRGYFNTGDDHSEHYTVDANQLTRAIIDGGNQMSPTYNHNNNLDHDMK